MRVHLVMAEATDAAAMAALWYEGLCTAKPVLLIVWYMSGNVRLFRVFCGTLVLLSF